MRGKTVITGPDANGRGVAKASVLDIDRAEISGQSSEFQDFLEDIEAQADAMNTLAGEDLVRAKGGLAERVAIARNSTEFGAAADAMADFLIGLRNAR